MLENPSLTRIFTWILLLLRNSGPHDPGSATSRHGGNSIDLNILLAMYLYINDFPYILLTNRHYLKWDFVPLLNLTFFGRDIRFEKYPGPSKHRHDSAIKLVCIFCFAAMIRTNRVLQIKKFSFSGFFLFYFSVKRATAMTSAQSCQKHVTKLVYLSKICSEKCVIGISHLLSTTSWNAILKLNMDE